MRTAYLMLALVLALAVGACGGRETRATKVTASFEAVRADFDGDWVGVLLLKDGTRLRISEGQVLNSWVCGAYRWRNFCVATDGVASVEYVDWDIPGPNVASVAVSAVALGLPAAMFIAEEQRSRREARQELEARYMQYAETRAELTGGSPLPPTDERLEEYVALSSFARCMGVSEEDYARWDRAVLAQDVWDRQAECLSAAAAWFRTVGEPAKARRLGFIESARERYVSLACMERPQDGLDLPDARDISPDRDWMEEYRAIVADPATYAGAQTSCSPNPEALSAAMGSFPLTEIEPDHLAASLRPLYTKY